ncbi:MAG: hypothetical protein ABIJ96_07170 [Elusimicrobiota bacterium]
MKHLPLIIFCVGVVVAALSAAPTPPKGLPFIIGLAITVAGGLMARSLAGKTPANRKKSGGSDETLTALALAKELHSMGAELKRLAGASVKEISSHADKYQQDIEKVLVRLNHLIDGRRAIQNQCGMQAFAEIYSLVAKLERNINRAWSALVDEYPREVIASLQAATETVHEAERSAKQHS